MALVDELLPVLRDGRGLIGEFGLRPYTITIQIYSYSGGVTLDGTKTLESSSELVEAGNQPVKVRWPTGDEIAIGQASGGDLIVGPITPSNSSGGYTPAQLLGQNASSGQVVLYYATGPGIESGAYFRLKSSDLDNVFGYTLTLAPLEA